MCGKHPRCGQNGFSLIELLIAMTLGLILLAGVVAVFITTNASLTTNRQLDRSQETLRFAATLLTNELRQASLLLDPDTGFPLELSPIDVDQEGADTHVITVRYEVVNNGEAVHCDGSAMAAGESVEKVFFVNEAGALVCQSGLASGTLQSPEELVFGLNRIRIEEWIGTPEAPEPYTLRNYATLAALEAVGDILVGVRILLEHERVAGQNQAFVMTVAIRNQVLEWFIRSQESTS